MLNTDKIKLMTKLSIYEDREGYNKKIVSRYFREDYVGYNMMISFVSVTAGYILLLILWALYFWRGAAAGHSGFRLHLSWN